MKLHPWNEVVPQAVERMNQGFKVYQQFNCAHCGAKQTMENPNIFYQLGTCEACGKETNIVEDGCNYMVTMGV